MTNYRYWLQITSSSWSFVSTILGQMTYLVVDSTPDCASGIGFESFCPSILLLMEIIRAIVTDVLVVIAVKTINEDVQLQALVDGKKVIVNEASIRRDLRLDDAEGTACLPNAAIFEELARTRVLSLEQLKTNQAAEIEKLKKRVKKHEGMKKKKRTHGLKRLYKGRMNDQDMFEVNNLDGDDVVVDVSAGEKEKQSEKAAEKEVSTADPVTTAGEVVM
nr:hypothetical protein [Tanacetum cinerariifolium]